MLVKTITPPSTDTLLTEAKADITAPKCGMYLTHCGIVREDAKAKVRAGAQGTKPVVAMDFSYDEAKVNAAIDATLKMDGIYYVKVWLASGRLTVGDDIMRVLIGGDIRPHVIDGLNALVGEIKNHCVEEIEIYE
ncbi:molybdenum cofactor biosynthesis protein MoaE [Eubacterium oxidoreducens]|nr:molybdenum cofactor biosynthesis protein MoaE [Eubacterium oxidoreducens]